MAYYAIGIGGTGAKCVESLIHLAAAGMMPDGELHVLFVDPDVANGSRARAGETLVNYVKCKEQLQLGQTNLLKTKIVPADPVLWTPFKDANPSLDKFFQYNNFRDSTSGKLFDVLYSSLEKETPLQEGFRGHPSIGSAVMAKMVDLQEDETWREFRKNISNDDGEAKVFLAGSIFGGTGASGFPTIAQIIKDALGVKVGGVLLLPYFKFMDDEDDGELKAKSDEFLMNTQTALKHYHLWDKTGIYDAVYLLGDESRTDVENALGGPEQRNAPHFIELFAALAAVHFFSKDSKDFDQKQGSQYFMTACAEKNRLQWTDLPDGKNGETIRSRIGQLARFAIAYLSVYRPALQKIADNDRDTYRASWYVDFFEQRKISIEHALLNTVEKYCNEFLLWLANIQGNHGDMEKIELIEYSAYAKKNDDGSFALKPLEDFSNDLSHLIHSQTEAESNVLDKIWKRMCNSRRKGRDAQDVGKFLRALYDNCGNKTSKYRP